MKYILEYKKTENHNLNNRLFIYDFGNIKGFLYNDNFTMYQIINKNNELEIIDLYEGIIPKTVFSIEEYDCEYKSGIYKTPEFDVLVTPFFSAESLPFESSVQVLLQPQQSFQQSPQHQQPFQEPPQPQQPQQPFQEPSQLCLPQSQKSSQNPFQQDSHQALQQKKHAYRKKSSHGNDMVRSVKVNEKVQPEDLQKQTALAYQTFGTPQWTSLEQLMKAPLILHGQVHQKQQKQLKPHLHPLKKKPFVSSQVRPHQSKVESHVQSSMNLTQY